MSDSRTDDDAQHLDASQVADRRILWLVLLIVPANVAQMMKNSTKAMAASMIPSLARRRARSCRW